MLFSARVLAVFISLFLQAGFIQLSYAAEFEFADTAAASFVSTKIDGLLAPRVPVAARVDLVARQGKVCSVPGGREYLFSFFFFTYPSGCVWGLLIPDAHLLDDDI